MAMMSDWDIKIEADFREFTKSIKKATRAINRFGFTLWLMDQPRVLRPLMRLSYWIEERMGLH